MGVVSLRLPASLHLALKERAVREGVSLNQLAAVALAEKVAALNTADFLQERARALSPNPEGAPVSRAQFLDALSRVPPGAADVSEIPPA